MIRELWLHQRLNNQPCWKELERASLGRTSLGGASWGRASLGRAMDMRLLLWP